MSQRSRKLLDQACRELVRTVRDALREADILHPCKRSISATGVPGPVTAFDPQDLDAWWETIPVTRTSNIYLPLVLRF